MKMSLFFKIPPPPEIKSKTKLLRDIAAETLKSIRNKKLGRFDRHSQGHGTRHSLETSVIFVNSAEIKEINKQFLNKNRITDVIAFNYPVSEFKGADMAFGDVFICLTQAKKQAAFYGHSLLKELAILTVHGCLHLKGMEDGTKEEKAAMDKKTEFYIRKYFHKKKTA